MAKKGKGKTRTVYRKAKKRFHRPKTIPILPIVGVAYGVLKPHPWGNQGDWANESMIGKGVKGDFMGLAKDEFSKLTGFAPDGSGWKLDIFADTYVPIVVTVVLHKALNFLGVNRIFKGLPKPANRLAL